MPYRTVLYCIINMISCFFALRLFSLSFLLFVSFLSLIEIWNPIQSKPRVALCCLAAIHWFLKFVTYEWQTRTNTVSQRHRSIIDTQWSPSIHPTVHSFIHKNNTSQSSWMPITIMQHNDGRNRIELNRMDAVTWLDVTIEDGKCNSTQMKSNEIKHNQHTTVNLSLPWSLSIYLYVYLLPTSTVSSTVSFKWGLIILGHLQNLFLRLWEQHLSYCFISDERHCRR